MPDFDPFAHLHDHGDSSAFDGVGRPAELAQKCAAMGQPGWALTDHGTMRGVFEAAKASREAGVKFVPGIEAYLADDATQRSLTEEEKAGVRALVADPLRRAEAIARGLLDEVDFDPLDPDEPVPTDLVREALKRANAVRKERDHITLWATSDIGLRNLFRLNAWAWSSEGGFFYKPRLDLGIIAKHAEGVAASTGCPGGVITSPVRRGALGEARKRMDRLADIFGDRLYVELMPHIPEEDCVHLPKKMLWLAEHYGATPIVTQDAHYPHEEDCDAQDALLCTHTKSKIHDPERFKFDAPQYWMKTRKEMEAAFEEKQALTGLTPVEAALGMDNTLAFLDRCTVKVEQPDVGKYMALPTLPDGWDSHVEFLRHLCRVGAKDRNLLWTDRYADRLETEFEEFLRLEALGRQVCAYFITAWDMRRWCRDNGVMGGPGRGSGAGCLVCYLLRITDLDPLTHGLLFERFLGPGRLDLPDLDLDVAGHRREEVIGYLRDTYGQENVAHIANHNRLGGRGTLKDLCRIFEVPSVDAEPLAALIQSGPQSEEDKSDEGELYSALIDTETGRKFAIDYPDAAAVAQRLEGNMRSTGVHAGGIVISSVPLCDIVPVESVQRSGLEKRSAMVAYDMEGAEQSGLVKLDVLGLTTLTMLQVAFERSGSKPEDVDLDDPEALQIFTDGHFAGVFQFDTNSARRASRGVLFRSFDTVAAITALNRPGPLKTGLADDFVARSNGDQETPAVHPIYDEVFSETFGVPVYQEQLVTLVRRLCGYTPEAADGFRKKVAKKKGVSDEEAPFLEGAIANGMSADAALGLFNDIVGFGQYSFNKSHSYTYAALAMWCAWLKVRFPAHFFAAALEVKTDEIVKLRLAAEARRLGIPVSPPNINHPHAGFRAIKTETGTWEILGGISDVRNVGPVASAAVADAAPFESLLDLRARVGKGFTAQQFGALAHASALRDLFPNSRFLAKNAKTVWSALKKGSAPELDERVFRRATPDEEAVRVGQVWPLFIGVSGRTAFDVATEAVAEQLKGWRVTSPGDEALVFSEGVFLVVGRAVKFKLFGEGGARNGRVILASADGEELPCRVDGDVADACPLALSDERNLALALVNVKPPYRPSVEAIWPLSPTGVVGHGPGRDFLLKPPSLKPADPGRPAVNLDPGRSFGVSGLLLRAKRHLDRNKNEMLTIGLLGPRGYVRTVAFSSRMMADDAALLEVGALLKMRLNKGERGTHLSDSPVEYVELPK